MGPRVWGRVVRGRAGGIRGGLIGLMVGGKGEFIVVVVGEDSHH